MEKRSGVTFPTELVEYMQSRHQAVASKIQPGKWHCFDVPFLLLCGDRETATEIHKHLAPLGLKCQLQISLQKA
jgi:hypothetical protein